VTDATAETKWTARTALSRFGEVAREDGARALWFKVWGELCYRRLALFELPLDSPVPQISARVPLRVAPLSKQDLRDYAALSPYSDAAEADPRLAAGHSCFVARSGNELLGSCWVARGQLSSTYLRTRIELGPDEACTYETYVAPAARGKNIGPAMRAEVADELRKRGVRRLLATVSPDNRSAIRLVEKLGYRRIGTIGYFGLGAWRRDLCRMRAGAKGPGAARHS
jgi:ribosomal protein S18 acetylase RimI-like enzyme